MTVKLEIDPNISPSKSVNQKEYKLLSTSESVDGISKYSDHTIQIETTLSPEVQRQVQNFSLIFLTVQGSLNPFLVRAAHKHAEVSKQQFLGSTTVFTTEVLRICMCCAYLCFSHGSIKILSSELWNTFVNNKRETIKVCIPALIYVIQNNLYFFALKHVEATLFSITYQMRILTTALLSVVLLKRVFSLVQWAALFISLLGVILVTISSQQSRHLEASDDSEEKRKSQLIGLTTIFVMCWTSAFAGVYLERCYYLPFSVLTMFNDGAVIQEHGTIYYGWTWLVWTISISSAFSGILVAAVMKYADNIKKSYSNSISLGGTAFLSIAFGDTQFTFILFIGVGLVIASVFLYTTNPPLTSATSVDDYVDNFAIVSDSSSSDERESYVEEINVKLKVPKVRARIRSC
uniref:Uncharacterized protein n=1 Tax=Ditylenchus dipsaci TaxID=166011 RepID=A0A915DID6_9BILA